MPYSAKTDVELAFGATNVRKWADLENTGLEANVLARIEWAIANADAELDARLAGSRYQFPLADPPAEGSYPAILVRMSAYKAGVLLYESRGVTDRGERGEAQHALTWHRKQFEEFVRDVWAKRVDLLGVTLKDGAVVDIDEGPTNVTFDDPADVASPVWAESTAFTTEGPSS
jgi:phage gp36-like protein